LLNNTIKHLGTINTCFIAYYAQLLNNSAFHRSAEILYGSTAIADSDHAIHQIDSDSTFVKLALTSIAFSTFGYTHYINIAPVNLMNVKAILHIQDIYIELAWRYLIYKYGDERAVLSFSNFIRCIFCLNSAVVKQTEETLALSQ
jgi:hypothetical protein